MKKSIKSRKKKKNKKIQRLISMSKRVRPYTKKDMYEDIMKGMKKFTEIEEEKKRLEKAEKLRLKELRKDKFKQLVNLRIAY